MPIYLHQKLEPEGELGLWKIEETEEYFLHQLDLTVPERAQLDQINGRRRVEWLAVRQLVHQMSGRKQRAYFTKDAFGKPHLENSHFQISISHSRALAAAIAAPVAVGIDIQVIVSRISRIAHKFMRPQELGSLEEPNKIEHLHVYWGAKEALYKAYGRRKLDFCKNILIEPFAYDASGGTFSGKVKKDDFEEGYTLSYQMVGEFMLVYALAK